MQLLRVDHVKMTGEFDERVQRSIDHMNNLNVDEMRMEFTNPSERWHWGADYMGRWIGAMVFLSAYRGEDYGVAQVLQELLDFQEEDGSFGPFSRPHDKQEWFGMGRGLVGLLEYYEVTGEPAALEAAKRLGDYYAGHYPEDIDHLDLCECYPSGLDGIVLLAHITSEQKYLDLAYNVADHSSVSQRCYYSTGVEEHGYYRTPMHGHTHCQLLTAKGMIDLNDLFGDSRYMQAVFDLHDFLRNEVMWISGGIPEYVTIPHINETCSDVDWLRVNLQLWKTTGDQKYFELAENILLNQICFDQVDTGAFCFWRGLQGFMGSTFDACCSHHGARALAEIIRYIYTVEPGKLHANLFIDGTARPEIDGVEVEIAGHVGYQDDEMVVSYRLNQTSGKAFAFRVRVPEWAGSGRLRLNDQEAATANEPRYLEIDRVWQRGDHVELRLPMKIRLVPGQRIGRYIIDERDVSIFYGPRLFTFVDTKNLDVSPPMISLDLSESIRPLGPDQLQAWAWTAAGERKQVILTPLANLGGKSNGIGRIHSVRTPYFRVWLPVKNAANGSSSDRKE
jgi:uncharacterized protein